MVLQRGGKAGQQRTSLPAYDDMGNPISRREIEARMRSGSGAGGGLLGGLVIGLAENLSGAYLGGTVKEIVPYVILLAVLLVRPTGFFGSPEDKRV